VVSSGASGQERGAYWSRQATYRAPRTAATARRSAIVVVGFAGSRPPSSLGFGHRRAAGGGATVAGDAASAPARIPAARDTSERPVRRQALAACRKDGVRGPAELSATGLPGSRRRSRSRQGTAGTTSARA
jgi:hypothetical protein